MSVSTTITGAIPLGSSAYLQGMSSAGDPADFVAAPTELSVIFSGGTGPLVFLPCGSTSGTVATAFAAAQDLSSGGQVVCAPFSAAVLFPVPYNETTFGASTFVIVSLAADSLVTQFGTPEGNASATFNGFVVYDLSGNLLPNVTWQIIDSSLASAPEPASLWLCAAAIGTLFRLRWSMRRP